MPRPIFRLMIVVFWLVMTGWLVKAEVIPRMGFGDVDFQSVLAQRAVEETTRWNIKLDGQDIGTAGTIIHPNPDGSFSISTELRLSVAGIIGRKDAKDSSFSSEPRLYVASEMLVDALGRLASLKIEFSPWESSNLFEINGVVEGEQLVLRTSGVEGIPIVPQEVRIPIDPEDLFADRFVPYDRLPDLRVGKKWTTRSINPLANVPGPVGWFIGGKPVEVTLNEVVLIQYLRVKGQTFRCFVVEHRRDDSISRTWVRSSNGEVLKREASFAGRTITFSLETIPEE